MPSPPSTAPSAASSGPESDRSDHIVAVLVDAFSELMADDPAAFRVKFRKMAADPFAFYRGTASVFCADQAETEDRWADDRTSRVWIHGDLHAENFGTYMDSQGRLVFDVNDFDEAYVGPFTWDLRRFVASFALLGWRKAFPDDAVRALCSRYLRAYLSRVERYAAHDDDAQFALTFDNARGPVAAALHTARLATRIGMLDALTLVEDVDRHFRRGPGVRDLEQPEIDDVCAALDSYIQTIPADKRKSDLFYRVKDIVGRKGFGIGSAGLPAYNVLVEGPTQALENDVVLTLKQGNVPAASRVVGDSVMGNSAVRDYFQHEGHRTVVSQRALQLHTDPLLGYTEIRSIGFVVAELSPYEADLDWDDLTEPDDMSGLMADLGQATAKVHCVSDSDSEQDLVDFQTEDAVCAVVAGREDEFVADVVDFGVSYGARARADHALFVEAFRSGAFEAVSAT